MKKIYVVLLFTSINLTAQIDTTRREFYPLQIKNLWQYRTSDNFLFTAKIRTDTILNNEQYFVFETVGTRTQGGVGLRIDSLMRVQSRRGAPIGGDSCGGNNSYEMSIYHLDEADSTVWEICNAFSGHLGIPLLRFNKTFLSTVFGESKEVMQFNYGGGTPKDTIWSHGALLARGIGILEEFYFDGDFRILQGAIINGVQYGNIVAVEQIAETIPDKMILYPNYPNPFNPLTTIRYEISKTTDVKLKILNVIGEEIMVLVDEIKYPGSYEVEFDASGLSSGVYVALLQTPEALLTHSMLLIK